ncbi:MAG: biotin/lipoyl-containing protein [Oscillospiraceae bacterium]
MKYVVTLNGMNYEVDVDELNEAIVTSATPVATAVEPVIVAPVATAPVAAAPAPVATPVAAPAPAPVSGNGSPIPSPMPGTILSVNVTVGQAVKEGDILFILEAMKMENELTAPMSGTITSIVTTKGSTVSTDEVLAFIG